MKRNCKGCVHYEVCQENRVCDDFFPINDWAEEVYIERLIESGRRDFHAEWHEYITKCYD